MNALFLDTATQFARHWHADSERAEIAEQLDGRRLYCSRYVECQYKAVLLNSAVALYNLLIRFEDLNRALRECERYQNKHPARPRCARPQPKTPFPSLIVTTATTGGYIDLRRIFVKLVA